MTQSIALGGSHKMVKNTGWVSFAAADSFTNVAGAGIDWQTPSGGLTEDVANAVVFFLSTGNSDQLQAINLAGDPVPATAIVRGVELRYMRTGNSANSITDVTIQLVKNGTASGTNKSTGAAWPTSVNAAEIIFGGAADMWGLELTPADINAVNFGAITVANGAVAFQSAAIDIIQMRITYLD